MPLSAKGNEIKSNMENEYGKEKGERVFYASKNKGTISGVDGDGEFKIGENVHLGLSTKGGAGFKGVIKSLSPHEVVIEAPGGEFGPRQFKGHPSKLSKDAIEPLKPDSERLTAREWSRDSISEAEESHEFTDPKSVSGAANVPGTHDEEAKLRTKPMTRMEREHRLRQVEADAAHTRAMELAKSKSDAAMAQLKAKNDAAHIMKDYDFENAQKLAMGGEDFENEQLYQKSEGELDPMEGTDAEEKSEPNRLNFKSAGATRRRTPEEEAARQARFGGKRDPKEEEAQDFEQGYEATLHSNGVFHSRSPLFIRHERAISWLQQEIAKLKSQGKTGEGNVNFKRARSLDSATAHDRMPIQFTIRARNGRMTLLEGLAMDSGQWFIREGDACRMFGSRKEAEGFMEYAKPAEMAQDETYRVTAEMWHPHEGGRASQRSSSFEKQVTAGSETEAKWAVLNPRGHKPGIPG